MEELDFFSSFSLVAVVVGRVVCLCGEAQEREMIQRLSNLRFMTSSMGSGRSSLIYLFFDVCSCSRLPRRGRYSIGGAHWPQHTNRFRLIVHPAAEQIAVVSQSKAQAMMMMMKKPKRSIEKQSKAIFPQFQFLLRKSSWCLLILRGFSGRCCALTCASLLHNLRHFISIHNTLLCCCCFFLTSAICNLLPN